MVEVDGGQHADSKRDQTRTTFIEREGYRVIRFWNNEISENLEGVLITIARALSPSPPPTPSRMREGKSRDAAKGWEV